MAIRHSNRNGLIAAVAYLRMSSDKQEASPKQQRDEIKKLAKQDGYRIIRWYQDSGISGDATEKRHDFQRMIADADAGDFNAIIVWDIDRFGRFDSIEAGRWIYPLREADVKLVTVTDGVIDWTDFAGRLMYNIKQEGKQQFLRDLSRNTMRGKLEAAKRGDWLGRAPIGYAIEDKRLVLGPPNEVELVRDIFAWYLAGDSIRAITRRLNDQGKASAENKLWIPSTVQDILKRVTYTGTFRWGDEPQGKYHRQAEPIVISDNHPAIIEQKTFDAVQQRLEERKKRTTPHINGGKFLLTGKLRCGKCGGTMFGTIPSKGQAVSYICNTDHSKGKCDRNAAKQDELLRHVIDAIVERFTNPKVVKRLRDELHKQVKATTRKVSVEQIRKKLATVDRRLAKARRRLIQVDDDMVTVVTDEIRSLTGQRKELQVGLDAAKVPTSKRLNDIDAKVDKSMKLFAGLKNTLKRADTVRLRELLNEAIDKVEVWSVLVKRGRRDVFQLDHGVIHVRGDQLQNLSPSSCRWPRHALNQHYASEAVA